jgi:hypothetical protein
MTGFLLVGKCQKDPKRDGPSPSWLERKHAKCQFHFTDGTSQQSFLDGAGITVFFGGSLKDANEGKASEPKAGDASPIGSWQLR